MQSTGNKRRRTTRPALCEGCDGTGVRVPATPACRIKALRESWIVVERCDSCERYTDDLSAALTYFRVAGWFLCENRGEHALADSRTRIARSRRRGRSP